MISRTSPQIDTEVYIHTAGLLHHHATVLTHQWAHKQPYRAQRQIPDNEDDILQEVVCILIINFMIYVLACNLHYGSNF